MICSQRSAAVLFILRPEEILSRFLNFLVQAGLNLTPILLFLWAALKVYAEHCAILLRRIVHCFYIQRSPVLLVHAISVSLRLIVNLHLRLLTDRYKYIHGVRTFSFL